jgi:hypothetical protein
MGGFREQIGRRSYAHGRRALGLALGYLGVVVLSAIPFLSEVVTGRGEGSFSFLFVMLTTAPLGLVLLPLLSSLSEWLGDVPALGIIALLLYALVALTQAWLIWRLSRGPAIT